MHILMYSQISIHVPNKGTTYTSLQHVCISSTISIHVPNKGTTFGLMYDYAVMHISIHVPNKGTTFRM